jgi:uncharacterized protein (TIRG00374 family)
LALTRRQLVRTALSTAAGLGLVALLAAWGEVDLEELWRTLLRLPPGAFVAALGLHAAIYLARAERFRLLLPAERRPRRPELLAVTAAHNLAVYVLPAKTGEATLPLYLRDTSAVPVAESLASLIVSRLLDLSALCGLLAGVTLALAAGEHWSAPRWTALALAAALALAGAAFLLLAARGDALIAPLFVAAKLVRLERTALGVRLAAGAERLELALRVAGQGRLRVAGFALSLAIWALIFVFYGVLALGFGLPEGVGWLHASFGSSVAVLTNLLPINSFAGFGTQETGWVLGFRLVGVPAELSLPGGIGVHLVQLFDTVLFGLAGHAAMGLARRR